MILKCNNKHYLTEISKRNEKYKSWGKNNTFTFNYAEERDYLLIIESWNYNLENDLGIEAGTSNNDNYNNNFLG